ncbi:MAG: helix-turn-helix transcriptional regulator [Actinomycetes bacterium]|nr:MAG: transcriptional regulator [Actinomycetota bacterium]
MPNYTIRLKWLGNALNKIRKETGLTIEAAAERLGWPQSKISRIENGMIRAHWGDIQDLLDLYGFADPDQRKALIALAKSIRERGWWHTYGANLPQPFTDLLNLETISKEIWAYETQVIPGLLQTRDYALAVVGGSRIWERREEVEKFVQIRTARQTVLTRSDPLHLSVILGEAALRQRVGGSAVMHHQLRHLLTLAELPNLTIQVLPFSAGASTGIFGPFEVLEFTGTGVTEVVYLENLLGGLYLENETEVHRYRLAFQHLRASALPVADSLKLIGMIAEEMSSDRPATDDREPPQYALDSVAQEQPQR